MVYGLTYQGNPNFGRGGISSPCTTRSEPLGHRTLKFWEAVTNQAGPLVVVHPPGTPNESVGHGFRWLTGSSFAIRKKLTAIQGSVGPCWMDKLHW